MKPFFFVAVGSALLFSARGIPLGCASPIASTAYFGDAGEQALAANDGSDDNTSSLSSSAPSTPSPFGSSGSSGSANPAVPSTSSSGSPAGASSSGGSSGSTSNGSGSSSGAIASNSSSGSSGGAGGNCPSGLQDKTTTCTASSASCTKGCGPNVAGGGKLGTKGCSCNTSTQVYNCQQCAYPNPLPQCYRPSGAPPPCASGVGDGASCNSPCGGVCTISTDAGKTDGCVCVMGSSNSSWSCATQWW